jgi:hypothetical protein
VRACGGLGVDAISMPAKKGSTGSARSSFALPCPELARSGPACRLSPLCEAAEAGADAEADVDAAAAGEVVEIDDWLVDFANLFREVSGLDPAAATDFAAQGWDAASRAMEATLRADAAAPLFEAAGDKFREVTCSGLLNWCVGGGAGAAGGAQRRRRGAQGLRPGSSTSGAPIVLAFS